MRAWTETPCGVTPWNIEVEAAGESYQTMPEIACAGASAGTRRTGHIGWLDPQAPWQAVLEKQRGTRW